jgi:hypothetical protein
MKYKYIPQKKLLGSSTFKMQKSGKFKYLSEILHLAPSKIGGVNICANASPVCIDLCLNTSGRGCPYKVLYYNICDINVTIVTT